MRNALLKKTMRMLPLLGGLWLLAAGCGDDPNYTQGAPGEAGVPPRTVSDANFRGDEDTASGEVGGDGGSVDSADAASASDASDGGDGSADVARFRMEITIASPVSGGVAPAAVKFTPIVDVLIVSPDSSASDSLKDVSAEVIERTTKKVVAMGKLNQIGFHNIPETGALVYNFAETPIDLALLPSGNYDLVVKANTNGGHEAKATAPFQVDAGPEILIASPIKDKPYKGSAPIDVNISDDYFGPVSDVQLKIGQTAIQVSGPGGASGEQYTATLDFASFSPALEGEQILTVRAKNKNGTESVLVRKFVSDSKGPTFADALPQDGQLVGNVITISITAKDPAGVLPSSVVAVFANGPGSEYTIPLRAPVDPDPNAPYSAVFDTRLLPFGENALFPTLSFRASDSLGNESLLTNVVWLDNRPPLSELDPPDMRIFSKTDSGSFSCGWPFDPVGTDAADDGDIVPQVTDLRARIEDQGNDPLSGIPNYIPVASVDSAQLLVLDDISQPLLVNTNPTVAGNSKTDNFCDAVNPTLIPTTRPMTSKDALVITLTPISTSGTHDLTNYEDPPGLSFKVGDERVMGGADWGCPGGDGAKSPDPVCEITRHGPKARWFLFGERWIPRSYAMTIFLGYGGGGSTTKLPSIWTIPKQAAGAASPLCGGTQLDTLANFVNDGWACLAIAASDKLGNKQVSRPFRLCVDKDGDGKECPHMQIARVYDGTPLVVETVANHGLVTGAEVRVSGITMVAMVNGIWNVTRIDDRRFSLNGSKTAPQFPAGDWVRPTPSESNPFVPGHVVRTAELPNCTGTVTAATPTITIDSSKTCAPWRLYKRGEMRTY